MKKILFILAVLGVFGAAGNAQAGNIDKVFGEGVFDLQWGASLDDVKKAFPDGTEKEMSGLTYYETNDGRTLFGIEREKDSYMRFGFDSAGRLQGIAVEFQPDLGRLSAVLNSRFGPSNNAEATPLTLSVIVTWPDDNGVHLSTLFVQGEKPVFGSASPNKLTLSIWKTLEATATDKKQIGF